MNGVIFREGNYFPLTWAEYDYWMRNPLPLGWYILVKPQRTS